VNGYVGAHDPAGDAVDTDEQGLPPRSPHLKTFFKQTDFPDPSQIYVFLDQHPDSISAGSFMPFSNNNETLHPTGPWNSVPASYHNGACGFSFADGHSEIHRWRDGCTVVPVTKTSIGGTVPVAPDRLDYLWVAQRATVCDGSYRYPQ
jgi:prepilin-type processing-associated H-X9-DG protein